MFLAGSEIITKIETSDNGARADLEMKHSLHESSIFISSVFCTSINSRVSYKLPSSFEYPLQPSYPLPAQRALALQSLHPLRAFSAGGGVAAGDEHGVHEGVLADDAKAVWIFIVTLEALLLLDPFETVQDRLLA